MVIACGAGRSETGTSHFEANLNYSSACLRCARVGGVAHDIDVCLASAGFLVSLLTMIMPSRCGIDVHKNPEPKLWQLYA